MLRSLVHGLENLLGDSLDDVSLYLYVGGLVVLALVLIQVPWRLFWTWRTARKGLVEGWTVTCSVCHQTSAIKASECPQCGSDLDPPLLLRWRARVRSWLDRPALRKLSPAYQITGFLLLLAICGRILVSAEAWSPQGQLHRLFLGLVFLSLAILGRSAGRALGLGRHGILGRLGEGLLAFAAVGALSVSLVCVDAARPVSRLVLTEFTAATSDADRSAVQANPNGRIGFEYLQIDHQIIQYRWIVPLALVGKDRQRVAKTWLGEWTAEHLREHAVRYTERGLTIRLRTDWITAAPGQSYVVTESQGQVLIQPAKSSQAS